MQIIEGIKMKGVGVRIPDCNRRDLPRFFKQMGYKVGVEIGVQRGAFTRRLARIGLRVYGIDPWLAYPDYNPIRGWQKRQDHIYEVAKKNLLIYPNCTLIKKTSMEAVKNFEDESIDFIYIDGHHGFKYVTEDIYEWSKKVRKGGCISGHDYAYGKHPPTHPWCLHVKYVVDAYTRAFEIKNWWILGADKKTREGEKRDQYRSWIWIKE